MWKASSKAEREESVNLPRGQWNVAINNTNCITKFTYFLSPFCNFFFLITDFFRLALCSYFFFTIICVVLLMYIYYYFSFAILWNFLFLYLIVCTVFAVYCRPDLNIFPKNHISCLKRILFYLWRLSIPLLSTL